MPHDSALFTANDQGRRWHHSQPSTPHEPITSRVNDDGSGTMVVVKVPAPPLGGYGSLAGSAERIRSSDDSVTCIRSPGLSVIGPVRGVREFARIRATMFAE